MLRPNPVAADFAGLIQALAATGVEFIVVGGVAGAAHGLARATYDLDVVYSRTPANLDRVVAALAPLTPYLRGAPPGLPFRFDVETLHRGLNFTLTTTLGDLDLLGEITGGGGYSQLLSDSVDAVLFDVPCRLLGLERLIHVKRAAGRPKDLEVIAELEALKEERDREQGT
ncbi:MAG TPA: hypothetical protein VFM88_14235 [Vicinamibacteria bacterium]|nr:hypothetical protein [Vicinamibacteria bacterium]